jgi:hypothetical protein
VQHPAEDAEAAVSRKMPKLSPSTVSAGTLETQELDGDESRQCQRKTGGARSWRCARAGTHKTVKGNWLCSTHYGQRTTARRKDPIPDSSPAEGGQTKVVTPEVAITSVSTMASRDLDPHPATHWHARKARTNGDARQRAALTMLNDRVLVLETRNIDFMKMLGDVVDHIEVVNGRCNHLQPLVAQHVHYFNDLDGQLAAKHAELVEANRESSATENVATANLARIQHVFGEMRVQFQNMESMIGTISQQANPSRPQQGNPPRPHLRPPTGWQ